MSDEPKGKLMELDYSRWRDWRFYGWLILGIAIYAALIVVGSALVFVFGQWCARLLGWAP